MSPTVLRLFIIVGIFLTLILLICTGTGIIAYRDYANSKNQSSLQTPWQLPKDEPLPESLRDDLQRAGANPLQIEPDRPHLNFQKWIQSQNGPLEVDYPRFAKAMQDSGVTQSVNWVNNWIIAQALKQSDLGPPELSGNEQILAADWIVANREARLVVSIPSQGFGIGALYAIWLVKHQSTWRIFDWKDPHVDGKLAAREDARRKSNVRI